MYCPPYTDEQAAEAERLAQEFDRLGYKPEAKLLRSGVKGQYSDLHWLIAKSRDFLGLPKLGMSCCYDSRWALPCDCTENEALRHVHDCSTDGCPKRGELIADPPPNMTPSGEAEYWASAHRCPVS